VKRALAHIDAIPPLARVPFAAVCRAVVASRARAVRTSSDVERGEFAFGVLVRNLKSKV